MISNIKNPVIIIISLSFAAITSCINNPATVNYGTQHVYEIRDTELNYISSVVEKDDSTLIAISPNKLFRIDKRSNVPEVKVLLNSKLPFYHTKSDLYKDRADQILFYDCYNYNLCRINFLNDTCNIDTILENDPINICQDDSGNIWLISIISNRSFLFCWDGQSVKRKCVSKFKYDSPIRASIASDIDGIYLIVQESDSVLISKYSYSDSSLSIIDSFNMDNDSCNIMNAFIVGGKLNLLLGIRGLKWMTAKKSDFDSMHVFVNSQPVIVSVEKNRILFRDYFSSPYYYVSSPVLKTSPDECWIPGNNSVYKITPDKVSSISVLQNNGLYINRSGELMMFYNPTLKSINLRDVM